MPSRAVVTDDIEPRRLVTGSAGALARTAPRALRGFPRHNKRRHAIFFTLTNFRAPRSMAGEGARVPSKLQSLTLQTTAS